MGLGLEADTYLVAGVCWGESWTGGIVSKGVEETRTVRTRGTVEREKVRSFLVWGWVVVGRRLYAPHIERGIIRRVTYRPHGRHQDEKI